MPERVPFLLSPNRTRWSADQLRRKAILHDFGRLAMVEELPAEIPASPDGDMESEWRRAVAEELLLRNALGRNVPEAWAHAFADVLPFDSLQVPLAEIWNKPAACAVFPLNTQSPKNENAQPGVGHVWIIEGLDARSEKSGIDCISPGFGAGFVTTANAKNLHGRSW